MDGGCQAKQLDQKHLGSCHDSALSHPGRTAEWAGRLRAFPLAAVGRAKGGKEGKEEGKGQEPLRGREGRLVEVKGAPKASLREVLDEGGDLDGDVQDRYDDV